MNDPDDPPVLTYATPMALDVESVVRVENGLLVVPHSADLPRRCIRCGEPATHPYRRRFHWHSRWIFLALFLPVIAIASELFGRRNVLPGGTSILIAIGGMVLISLWLQSEITLIVWLCDRHRSKRIRRAFIACVMGVCGLAVNMYGLSLKEQGRSLSQQEFGSFVALSGFGIIGATFIWSYFSRRFLRIAWIADDGARFRGASIGFLDHLSNEQPDERQLRIAARRGDVR